VATADTSSDPAHPSRLEKKMNTARDGYQAKSGSSGEEFVRFFERGWAAPKPDGFVAHFRSRAHPDLRLRQPLVAAARGPDGLERQFRDLFAIFPDYRVEVVGWAERGDAVFIELTHSVPVAGRRLSWPGMDRFLLEGELFRERLAVFDPSRFLGALLLRPGGWAAAARAFSRRR
jgi:hypothetical protein